MKGYQNPGKNKFLASLPSASLDLPDDTLASRCKFNFSYYEVQQNVGQCYSSWDQEKLISFLDKLRAYSKESLSHWQTMRVGKSGTVLALYGAFPANSGFCRPKHVPHQARWGRFRMDWAGRLCGFVVPPEYSGQTHGGSGHLFDCNTFYVVFIDEDHEFYKTNESK